MHRNDAPGANASRVRARTDTPLEMPTMARAARLAGRILRLQCPNCGAGRVLKWDGGVHERCSGCNLRFQRGDGHYFFGAMFFGVMLGEVLFAVAFAIILVSTWPNVPWKFLQFALPIGVLVAAPLFIPFSKIVFLGVDIFIRPVSPEECITLHSESSS